MPPRSQASSFRPLFLLAFIILAVFTYTSVHSLLLTPEAIAGQEVDRTAEVRRRAQSATRKMKQEGLERAHQLAERLRDHGAAVAQPGRSAAVMLAEQAEAVQPGAAAAVAAGARQR